MLAMGPSRPVCWGVLCVVLLDILLLSATVAKPTSWWQRIQSPAYVPTRQMGASWVLKPKPHVHPQLAIHPTKGEVAVTIGAWPVMAQVTHKSHVGKCTRCWGCTFATIFIFMFATFAIFHGVSRTRTQRHEPPSFNTWLLHHRFRGSYAHTFAFGRGSMRLYKWRIGNRKLLLTTSESPGATLNSFSKGSAFPLFQRRPNKSWAHNSLEKVWSEEPFDACCGFCKRCHKVHGLHRTPLAKRHARELMSQLRRLRRLDFDSEEEATKSMSTHGLYDPGPGHMFGVLVCATQDDEVVVLKAFSGQHHGLWNIPGWEGPVCTLINTTHKYRDAQANIIRAGQAYREQMKEEKKIMRKMEVETEHYRDRLRLIDQRALQNRTSPLRKYAPEDDKQLQETLNGQLLRLDMEKKELQTHFEVNCQSMNDALGHVKECARQCKSIQRRLSKELHKEILDSYSFRNFRGHTASLRGALCDPSARLPSGVGDCCAPKLLNAAAIRGLKPLGIAEFWWGTSTLTKSGEIREEGCFYNACQERCHHILGYMLCGIDDMPKESVVQSSSPPSGT